MLVLIWIGETDPPGPPVGVTSESAKLAEIDQHVVEPFGAQQRRDPVGDVALGNPVQGERHARPRELDAPRLDLARVTQASERTDLAQISFSSSANGIAPSRSHSTLPAALIAITVDASDNVWVAISGNTFGFPPKGIDKPHVKIFDKNGELIRDEVGLGMFKSFALNEIAFCPENGRTYVGDYGYGLWEVDGVEGTPKLIMSDVPIGDHMLGGITCRDGWLYYAIGSPTNSGFADPDIHGWTDAIDPYWEKRTPPGVPALPAPLRPGAWRTRRCASSASSRATG